VAQRPLGSWTNKPLLANAAQLRNIIHVSNHIMSHILHFYHLVALDYVKPTVHLGGGAFADINRPFLAPRYDDNYYINDKRILAIVGTGLVPPLAVGVLTTLPGVGAPPLYPGIGNAVNAYLVGQYLKALDIRRKCHEMQAIFSGRAPQCSGWTPGGATASVTTQNITDANALLAQIRTFVGEATDFATGTPGTMMFDVVAAAHLFPEYFWIGNTYHQFMAFGVFEEAGTVPLSPGLQAVYGVASYTNPDQRGLRRGYKLSAQSGAPVYNVDINKIGESIANSRYDKTVGGQYPGTPPTNFKHPWVGVTVPKPLKEYSWLKSPRYDISPVPVPPNYQPFEVGPLARMVVNGFYWAGILNTFYPLTPVLGQAGPNISTGSGHPLEAVYALIPAVTGGPNLSGVTYTGDSTLDRIAARAIECRLMIDHAQLFLNKISGTISGGWATTGISDDTVPIQTTVKKGYGMTEASRGALSHWIKYKNGKITKYQAVVPTTWNANPRDVNGKEGPAERSLQGTAPGQGTWVANPAEPIELPRVTHSYDFCIACAVHLITPEGEVKKVDIPAMPG
jgi:hydrogenase large subunit